MACRIILMFNMPVIQVYIVELYLLNRYNQRRDSMISWLHRETEWNCSKEIALVSIVYELIASIGYVLK